MKKLIALLLVSVMVLGLFTFVGCNKEEPLKLGLGVTTTAKASDATAEKAGQGQATTTAAAVLVDADGKIVKAFIDCADNKVDYTAEGKAVKVESFKTKYEQGKDYGMVAYGGSAKEWYEQADAFCALVAGKTVDEVKALVAADTKGTEEVLNAGCTIYVGDFAKAIENAVANAVESEATESSTLKLTAATTQTATDATAEKPGSNKVATTFFAAAVDAEGKVVAASSDCVEVSFGFDITGKSTFDATKAISSKKTQGADYGMVAYAGSAKEWFEQAAAFDAACIGKTASEINSLMASDGKGNADLVAAGCTIYVTDFVKAAAKIG